MKAMTIKRLSIMLQGMSPLTADFVAEVSFARIV